MITLLALLLCLFAPNIDLDGDGYSGCEERAYGCDPFDTVSRPYCADINGDGVGDQTLVQPRCEVTTGYAPCA